MAGLEEIDATESVEVPFPIETEIKPLPEKPTHTVAGDNRCPDHMISPYLAERADRHFQDSIQNVMKASEKNNLLLEELLPLITKLQREKAKFDESEEETCDLSEFQADINRIKEIYIMLKAQGHSIHELAMKSSEVGLDQNDAEAYLNKIFPEDLDLEKIDQWQFEELKDHLNHWRDSVKRDLDFNTNSLFAVQQLYISCHNVMQNMMRNTIDGRKKMTDNQIAR